MRIGISLVTLLLLPAACTASTDLEGGRVDRDQARTVVALENRADADSLAAAGLLSLQKHPEQSLGLLTQAVAVEPARADLVWLQVQSCRSQARCDPEPFEGRLRALDPSNGSVWLAALARADSLHDDGAKDAALDALGRSARVDIYWTTLIARLTRAVARTGVMSFGKAEVLVIGLLAAEATPAYAVASESCKDERWQRPDVVEVCRGIARAFERGDTYITEMIGVAIAKRVWPEESPEWVMASEARLVYEHRAKLFEKIDTTRWDEKAAKNYLALCAANHREQDVFRAILVQAGENPDPPRP